MHYLFINVWVEQRSVCPPGYDFAPNKLLCPGHGVCCTANDDVCGSNCQGICKDAGGHWIPTKPTNDPNVFIPHVCEIGIHKYIIKDEIG